MKIRIRWLDWLLAASVVVVCRVLFRTLRIHYLPAVGNTNPYTNDGTEGFIYSVWHDAIAFPMFAGRHVRTVALVSKNFDGSHLAYGLKLLNIGLVRGSSSRGGAERDARAASIAGDDARRVNAGRSARAAAASEVRECCFWRRTRVGRSCRRHFRRCGAGGFAGSWTNLTIPKPFTTVYALSGPPI